MKIVIDDKIPFLEEVLPSGVETLFLPGGAISSADVADADALIVRTRTRVDRELLEGSSVRHVSTATIGFDHIDMEYCQEAGVSVATSAGCNAQGVLQYVMAALIHIESLTGEDIRGKRLAIIGVGNVGGAIREVAGALGFDLICCDPLAPQSGFVSLKEAITSADIITTHTPLTYGGDYPTVGMFDDRAFEAMRDGAIFINSSRGEVSAPGAITRALQSGKLAHAVIDVWHSEPDIDLELLDLATIASPHIAGYSLQGKAMGSALALRSMNKALGIEGYESWYPHQIKPTAKDTLPNWEQMRSQMGQYYDIAADSQRLKSTPELFEKLRGDYNFRHEFFRSTVGV